MMRRMLAPLGVWITLLLALLMVMSDAHAAARAWLDRDTIAMGETVTLNVEVDGVLNSQPDLTPLSRDFRVVGSSSNAQISIVNGERVSRTLWAVALQPQAEGVIGIPSLAVGSDATQPLTLTVQPAPTVASTAAGDDAFLEVEADRLDPYVQQQVRYTVRLFYAVQLLEGQLDEPSPDGVRIQRVGNDATYQRVIGNRRYQVVERRYALSADQSGVVEIPAPLFRGRALGRGLFGGGQLLQATGDAVRLNVRPRPAQAPRPWLPAAELQLQDETPALPDSIRVGDPLTLTLRVSALGLLAEQLPELELPDMTGAQVYPDRESSQTREIDDWFRGERTRSFAVVPSQPGVLELPPVRISWWNTRTDQLEVAELPARQIQVLPARADAAVAPLDVATGPELSSDIGQPVDMQPAALRAWQMTSALLLMLWLATLAWALRIRQRVVIANNDLTPAAPPDRPHGVRNGRALAAALQAGDMHRIALALRTACPHGPCADLAEVAAQLDDADQRNAVRGLERAMYADGDRALNVAALQLAFSGGPRWCSAQSSADMVDALPSLYR